MSNFRDRAGSSRPGHTADARTESANDLSSLLNYPSLGRLFEGSDTRALEEMRARLGRTNQDLERVVRQGAKEEAERAARASRAVAVTLAFLDDLEQLRRAGGGK
ncbi:MAG TPA: hypothetical protein VER08_09275 [Pyrinomonadaceae bacterium]|nr:hypothetical protein [Pyrinomonadaceae bacterium]